MREILFRGQKISDKKWVYGSLLVADNKRCLIVTWKGEEIKFKMYEDVIPETVGQCTKYKDKKIYEGDIIRAFLYINYVCSANKEKKFCDFLVFFEDGAFWGKPVNNDMADLEINNETCLVRNLIEIAEGKLIGNIHDKRGE